MQKVSVFLPDELVVKMKILIPEQQYSERRVGNVLPEKKSHRYTQVFKYLKYKDIV